MMESQPSADKLTGAVRLSKNVRGIGCLDEGGRVLALVSCPVLVSMSPPVVAFVIRVRVASQIGTKIHAKVFPAQYEGATAEKQRCSAC